MFTNHSPRPEIIVMYDNSLSGYNFDIVIIVLIAKDTFKAFANGRIKFYLALKTAQSGSFASKDCKKRPNINFLVRKNIKMFFGSFRRRF